MKLIKDLLIGACIIFVLYSSLFTICTIFKTYPSAIDVYRGNTTLKITYIDGVPIDSTVVFKQ